MEPTYENILRAYHHIEARVDESGLERFCEVRGIQVSVDRFVNVICFNLNHRSLTAFQHIIPGVVKASTSAAANPRGGYGFSYETRSGEIDPDRDINPNIVHLPGIKYILLQTFESEGSVIFYNVKGIVLEINQSGLWIVKTYFRKSSKAKYEE